MPVFRIAVVTKNAHGKGCRGRFLFIVRFSAREFTCHNVGHQTVARRLLLSFVEQ
jgi:hypothetical protein